MKILCSIGVHNWKSDCEKCTECGKIRIDKHDWRNDCEKCSNCGMHRKNKHNWSKDCEECSICHEKRDNKHDWKIDCQRCSKCGQNRINKHDWSKDCNKCSICGRNRENHHDWSKDCERCSYCGKQRQNQHDWKGDCEKCSKCGKSSTHKHDWNGCKCLKCDRINFEKHKWVDGKCSICGKITIEWVDIPEGTFIMGSPVNEISRSKYETQHQVTISAFRMSKYEITNEQYDAFCEATSKKRGLFNYRCLGSNDKTPVVNVSWDDVKAFAEWLGCRLPTEAEWEYACRAGTKTAYSTGEFLTIDQANYTGNNPQYNISKGVGMFPSPVGSFSSNAWGLYDMHGNVSEWCSDFFSEYPIEHQKDPRGPNINDIPKECQHFLLGALKVHRGGSFNFQATDCRSANRGCTLPLMTLRFIGFRIVSSV